MELTSRSIGYIESLEIGMIVRYRCKEEIMAKKGMHSFRKYKEELKRKEKANEKLARRQGKKDEALKDLDEQGLLVEKPDES